MNNKDNKNHKNNQFRDESLYCIGIKPVQEILEISPQRIEWVMLRKGIKNTNTSRILDLCSEHSVRFSLADEDAFKRILPQSKTNTQNVIAKLKEVQTQSFEDMLIHASSMPLPLIVALDSVQDPGNLGTLARTLYALGGAGLVMPIHNSASLSLGAKKSAAGALDLLPLSRVTNLARALEEAADAGYTLYSTALSKNEHEHEQFTTKRAKKQANINCLNLFADRLEFPAILVLGGEEKGVRPLVHSKCHHSLLIPMQRDFDSLNVAQAGAILIAAFLKNYLEQNQ